MNLVELNNVSAYRGRNIALKKLSLALPLHQSHAILGPNGSGKSTLLKLITREIYPVVTDSSSIKVFGQENVNIWDLRKKIGFVSNDYQTNYLSLASGLDVVVSAFFGSVGVHGHHQPKQEMLNKSRDILDELNISELADTRYINLSTGQQRRLLLARALVHAPQALILDEPTAGLDLEAKFWLLNKIESLCDQGISIVLVTHDPSEIVPSISHVSMLKNGELKASGEKEEVLTEANLSELYRVPLKLTTKQGYYLAAPEQA